MWYHSIVAHDSFQKFYGASKKAFGIHGFPEIDFLEWNNDNNDMSLRHRQFRKANKRIFFSLIALY